MSTTSRSPNDHEKSVGFGWLSRGDEPGARAQREAQLATAAATTRSEPPAASPRAEAAPVDPAVLQPRRNPVATPPVPTRAPAPSRIDPTSMQTVINFGLVALLCIVGVVVTFEAVKALHGSTPSSSLRTDVSPATPAPTSAPHTKPPVKAAAPVTATTARVPVTTPVTSPAPTTPQTAPRQITRSTTPPRTTPPATAPAVHILSTPTTIPSQSVAVPSSPTTAPAGPTGPTGIVVPVGQTP